MSKASPGISTTVKPRAFSEAKCRLSWLETLLEDQHGRGVRIGKRYRVGQI
jgi:hypothetical protein